MTAQTALLLAVLGTEGLALYLGQRFLFLMLQARGVPRVFLYLWAMPGTVLHELAHVLACLLVRAPIIEIKLFDPRPHPNGGVILGNVTYQDPGPIRQTVVSIAPLLLVPPALLGIARLVIGPDFDLTVASLASSDLQSLGLLAYIFMSAGAAAFPSPGDRIPPLGAFAVAGAGILLGTAVPTEHAAEIAGLLAVVMAPAAVAAALQLIVLFAVSRLR